jgi:hypothetical protein
VVEKGGAGGGHRNEVDKNKNDQDGGEEEDTLGGGPRPMLLAGCVGPRPTKTWGRWVWFLGF